MRRRILHMKSLTQLLLVEADVKLHVVSDVTSVQEVSDDVHTLMVLKRPEHVDDEASSDITYG